MQLDRQQQEPTEAIQELHSAALEPRRNPASSAREDVKAADPRMGAAPPMNSSKPAPVLPIASELSPRLYYIDNLRWTLVILVISMHAADTYSPLGNWYFVARTPLSTPVLLFFAAWQMFLQAFFMGFLFFIAGLFVPPSFDRKGPVSFVRDPARRLGVPLLFYMFVLGPVTEY
jgi:acyltransferase-like protein